jgi:hypothetical protein
MAGGVTQEELFRAWQWIRLIGVDECLEGLQLRPGRRVQKKRKKENFS